MDRLIKWGTVAVIALAVIALVVVAPLFTIASYNNENTYEIKVTDKETKTTKDSSKYLIFGEDEKGNAKVFENTDALFARSLIPAIYTRRLRSVRLTSSRRLASAFHSCRGTKI